MMLKPSIDSLLEKVDSKYSLVILASKRAHELEAMKTPQEGFESVKRVGQALEEIDAGDVIVDPNPELKRAIIKHREDEETAMKNKAKAELEAKIKLEKEG